MEVFQTHKNCCTYHSLKAKKKASNLPKQRTAIGFCPIMPFVPQLINTSFKTHYLPYLIFFFQS